MHTKSHIEQANNDFVHLFFPLYLYILCISLTTRFIA
jgi:hypothetical protein